MNITFKEWLNFNEGTTVSIKDYDYHQNTRDPDEIATAIYYNVLQNHMKSRDPNSKVQHHEIISPDGSYYNGTYRKTGEAIISLYTEGWSQEIINKIIKDIKTFLDNKYIKYGPFRSETSGSEHYRHGPVIRIPILQSLKPQGAPEVGMSVGNDQAILNDILKLNIDFSEGGEVKAADLLIAIQNVNRDMVDLHSREYYGRKTPQGGESHHMGLSPEQIIRKLGELGHLAQWALQQGYDTLQIS